MFRSKGEATAEEIMAAMNRAFCLGAASVPRPHGGRRFPKVSAALRQAELSPITLRGGGECAIASAL